MRLDQQPISTHEIYRLVLTHGEEMGLDGSEISKQNQRETEQAIKRFREGALKIQAEQLKTQKADDRARTKAEKEKSNKQKQQAQAILLDCPLCETAKAMQKGTVYRFGELLRFVGWVCAAPAVFVILLMSILILFAILGHIQFDPVLFVVSCVMILLFSVSSGVVSWVLLSHRKVFFCNNCGYILERADSLSTKIREPLV